jgi:hypothetical protein
MGGGDFLKYKVDKGDKYIQGVPDCENLQIGSSIPLFAHFARLSVKLDIFGFRPFACLFLKKVVQSRTIIRGHLLNHTLKH